MYNASTSNPGMEIHQARLPYLPSTMKRHQRYPGQRPKAGSAWKGKEQQKAAAKGKPLGLEAVCLSSCAFHSNLPMLFS